MARLLLVSSAMLAAAQAKISFRGHGRIPVEEVRADLVKEINLTDSDLSEYEDGLRHMFVSMPKNAHGNLGHQAVRQAIFRFFVQRHGWWVRGFEDSFMASDVKPGHEEQAWAPDLLQAAFEKVNLEQGADLHALAALAASIELLTRQEANAHLLDCYTAEQVTPDTRLGREMARDITHTYFMSFILEHNWTVENKNDLLRKSRIFETRYPLYKNASLWLYKVFSQALGGVQAIGFDKTLEVAAEIGEKYHEINDLECGSLRQTLQSVESRKPGRVRLAAFYNMSLHSHWKFTESVKTLRNLGALDDSDPTQKYVIIPNYALAKPNCVNASNIYEICCDNPCESIMTQIEKGVREAYATPESLIALVVDIAHKGSSSTHRLEYMERRRLMKIAEQHNGVVPLHGRLFKQWLHHVFPLECPYPHTTGTTDPSAYTGQDDDQATDEEIQTELALDVGACSLKEDGKLDCGETDELAWDSTEELLVEHLVLASLVPERRGDASVELGVGLGLLSASLVALAWLLRSGALGRAADRQRSLAVPGTLALAGLASCIGLLDPNVAVLGAVGSCVANLVSQRYASRRRIGSPDTAKTI